MIWGKRGNRIIHRKRCNERQLGRPLGRRWIGEQQADVEIARLRHPHAPAPAAARALAVRRDPQRPALALARQCQRFRVGRADRIALDEMHAGRQDRRIEPHQNSDFAAALAASSSGAG
jgi:hypothetical protein